MSEVRPKTEFSLAIENLNEIPKDKEPALESLPGYGSGVPVANSGVVEIKCVINGKCPFVKSPYMHDILVFNAQSMKDYPEEVQKNLAAIPGAEGVFLRPRHLYRHTFIAGPPKSQENASFFDPREKIVKIDPSKGVFGSGSPVYERYQRFIIQPNVFDGKFLSPDQYGKEARDSATSCEEQAKWQYEVITPDDVSLDSLSRSVLMPKQVAGTTCNGFGVHWRLTKQTPLKQGQDFFVEFYRRSRSIDIPESARDAANKELSKPFVLEPYLGLDTLCREWVLYPPKDECGNDIRLRRNRAVCKYSDDGFDVHDDSTYNFRDQAYYVIELGYGPAIEIGPQSKKDTTTNTGKSKNKSASPVQPTIQQYFIIITQRGNPICVRLEDGNSILVSEFDNGFNVSSNVERSSGRISGKQIIESEQCRMTVRNHLGDLIVTFESPTFTSSPWIIHRVDSVVGPSKSTGGKFIYDETKMAVVGKGPISLWGGNMNSGFVFGILEYHQGSGDKQSPVKFTCPPQSAEKAARDPCDPNPQQQQQQQNGGVVEPLSASSGSTVNLRDDVRQNSLALPLNTTHSILLSSTDNPPNGFVGDFFTQDAQQFFQLSTRGTATVDGRFFNRSVSLKEKTTGKESKIKVQKVKAVQDKSRRMEMFKLDITLQAGGYTFDEDNGGYLDDDDGKVWHVNSCVTPVLTMVRLVAEPDETKDRWQVIPKDVSEHVIEFNDSWSAQDFFKIEHTGTIKFLVNQGAVYDNNQTEYLMSLIDKAFYIEVWARYRSVNDNNESLPSSPNGYNYSKMDGYHKLFTGICYGGTVMLDMGQRIIECQIFDYSKILQEMLFFNSPFYDGVKDIVAVREILRMAGLKDKKKDDPGVLVKTFAQKKDGQMHFGVGPDGRLVPVNAYALPNAYDKLSQPFFKFNDGDKFYDAIMKIGQKGGKCFYFDTYGVAHFESYFDFSVVGVMSGIDDALLGGSQADCSSGRPATSSTVSSESLALWWYTTNPDYWQGQMMYNSVKYSRAVGDVYNHVKIKGNTPDSELFFLDDMDWSSVDDPTKEGFLGYIKTVFQTESIFGSVESARNIMNFYKAMRRPPLVINFESYGQPVRALDTIIVCGQPSRVMKVDASISPKENRWWNTFECEWLYPSKEGLASLSCKKPPHNPAS